MFGLDGQKISERERKVEPVYLICIFLLTFSVEIAVEKTFAIANYSFEKMYAVSTLT